MAAEASGANAPAVLKDYQVLLPGAKIKFVPHTEFKKRTPSAIGLIRTGDTTQVQEHPGAVSLIFSQLCFVRRNTLKVAA